MHASFPNRVITFFGGLPDLPNTTEALAAVVPEHFLKRIGLVCDEHPARHMAQDLLEEADFLGDT